MSDAILSAKDIHKVYRTGKKDVHALDGVSIEIHRGDAAAIVGPSGAGKSTLLHILGGLDKPTKGHVMFDGIDLYRLSDKERADIRNKKIGFVFQFYYLLPEFTALENVMLPALIRSSRTQSKEKAHEILKLVGLKDRSGHRPGELSGGESQRVAIARALVNEPEVLLCDEPTGNLDSKTSESIYELLFKINSDRKTSLVIVTHDEKLASKVAKTIRIKDGKPA